MNDIGTNSSDGAKSDGGFGSINSNSNKFEVGSIPIPEKNGIITSLICTAAPPNQGKLLATQKVQKWTSAGRGG